MIQQEMQFHGSLAARELGPIEHIGTEVNQGRVDAEQFVAKPKLFTAGALLPTAFEEVEKKVLVQLPGTMLVGISQGGTLRGRDAQLGEFAFATAQPVADLAQRLRPTQLAKQHGYKLPPTCKSPSMALRPQLFDSIVKLQAWKKLEKLTENAAKSVHG